MYDRFAFDGFASLIRGRKSDIILINMIEFSFLYCMHRLNLCGVVKYYKYYHKHGQRIMAFETFERRKYQIHLSEIVEMCDSDDVDHTYDTKKCASYLTRMFYY